MEEVILGLKWDTKLIIRSYRQAGQREDTKESFSHHNGNRILMYVNKSMQWLRVQSLGASQSWNRLLAQFPNREILRQVH